MIFEYTQAEKERLIEIDGHYAELLDQIDEKLLKHGENTQAYADLLKERDNLEAARIGEFADIHDKAEKARFNALKNDPAAVAAEARRQVGLIIENRIKQDFVTNENGELQTRLEKNGKPYLKGKRDFQIPTLYARTLIYSGITLLDDFLKKNAPEEKKKLDNYISKYISTSPYIYIDTDTHKADGEKAITAASRPPLAPINTYGLMSDKINKIIISKPGTAHTPINGQMQILFNINQAAKTRQEVPVYISLTYEGTETLLNKKMTAFDSAVYNAISTIYYYNKRENPQAPVTVTTAEIWRTMNGIAHTSKTPSDKQLQKIAASMDKMRFTRFYMDISQEIDAGFIKNGEKLKGKYDTYLLVADNIAITTEKGRIIESAYSIIKEPVLYTYNAAKNHILWADYKLLDTTDTTGNEGFTVEFKNYLLQQIEYMYNGTRDSKRILFETLYNDTGIQPPAARIRAESLSSERAYTDKTMREAKRDRDKITAILEAWKKRAYIKDYKLIQKGRAFIGVDITLTAEQKKRIAGQ